MNACPQTDSAPGRRFTFGVDLDGCCGDYYKAMRPLAAEWLGVETESLTLDVSYDFTEWGLARGPGGYAALHRFAVTQRELFRKMEPIDGAATALRRLAYEHDIRIRIVTHRLLISHFYKPAASQTIEWLDYYGFPYHDLCFVRDKADVGADLYIEDAPLNVIQLRDSSKDVIIFSNYSNLSLPGERAGSWAEVETKVIERATKWKQTTQPA